jgi:thiol:disulfide interchange protein DsbD
MKEVRLLQIDVTVNNQDDRALMRKFGLFGPPGIILFKQGREVPQSRIIGYMGPDRFAATCRAISHPEPQEETA